MSIWLVYYYVKSQSFKSLLGYSQVEKHVNITLAAVGPGLAGKHNDLLRGPLLVASQSGHGCSLEPVRIALGLIPGSEFFS